MILGRQPANFFLNSLKQSTRTFGTANSLRDSSHFLELVTLKTRATDKIDFEALKKKALLVYFSASWCPSCRQLTPKLKKFYEQTSSNGLEVVWISRDRSAQDQKDYYEKDLPPWLYVPYGDDATEISHFLKVYEIKTIPAVKLVDIDGQVVDNQARAKIEENYDKDPNAVVEEWKKKLKLK